MVGISTCRVKPVRLLNICYACYQLGKVEFDSVRVAEEAASRESLIKQHYMQRIADLTAKLQLSDSKALHFHAEVTAT